jgi:3-dehydroquinate synthase
VAPTALCTIADVETAKTLQTVAQVIDSLVQARADRASVVVALGGGVVGDVAGFAASVFMRGVRVVQVPTTLLAQVDSAVGGKTGVNHPSSKNLIGTFHQPSVVVCDTSVLRSLPERELSAGLAEVLKHGLLADSEYFERTVSDLPALLGLNDEALAAAIARSCQIKAQIVGRDERERGERALLNLGHTFGHAIEALTGFGRWLHGEAVGCGLCLAGDLSSRLGLIGPAEVERIAYAVAQARLPARIEGLSKAAAIQAMRGDKKAHAGRIRFVVLERIGHAIQREAPDALVEATLGAAGYR